MPRTTKFNNTQQCHQIYTRHLPLSEPLPPSAATTGTGVGLRFVGAAAAVLVSRDKSRQRNPHMREKCDARSDGGSVGHASVVLSVSGGGGASFGRPLSLSGVAAGTTMPCFFCLLPHHSVRLDCCGGAFFPGGIVMNFAKCRNASNKVLVMEFESVPRVCCLGITMGLVIMCATLTRRGQVAMAVNI